MERDVRVNAEYFEDYLGGTEEEPAGLPVSVAGNADYGPCLYLGSAGQRCSRRALQGGFCALHQPGARRPVGSTPSAKRVAAVIGALVALLPWLSDLIRELIRLLR
ncbi:MAG: hypothetical protein WB460_18435 [Candidatus Acidiferrales bacterium]